MSYQTYITEAIVIQSYEHNTADKLFRLFTRQAGVILATARSVREERSKQRFALQDYSLITVSLVRGKSGWRIGSTESRQNLFLATSDRLVRRSVVRLTSTIRQYVQGEEFHPELFDECLSALAVLANDQLTDREAWEDFLVARLLYRLGYVASPTNVTRLTSPTNELSIGEVVQDQAVWRMLIEQAEQVSHLS